MTHISERLLVQAHLDAKQPKVGEAAYPYTGPSGYECMPQYVSDERGPFGRNVAATEAIRRAVRAAGHSTPVVCTGGMHGFEQAERLARGEFDLADRLPAAARRGAFQAGFDAFVAGDAETAVHGLCFIIRWRGDIQPGMWVRFWDEKHGITKLGEYDFKRRYLKLTTTSSKGVG